MYIILEFMYISLAWACCFGVIAVVPSGVRDGSLRLMGLIYGKPWNCEMTKKEKTIHEYTWRLHATVKFSRGNNCRFWQIFVEALEEFPYLCIQSETSTSTHEYSESNRASKYVMLLSNFENEHRGLSPISEAGFPASSTSTCCPDCMPKAKHDLHCRICNLEESLFQT